MCKIWAIGDLHLSFASEKPMDIFGSAWDNHEARLKDNWLASVAEQDTILIAGDISWAMGLEDVLPDLKWIEALPGHKVILKGNHEYWWTSISKIRALDLDERMMFLQNDCVIVEKSRSLGDVVGDDTASDSAASNDAIPNGVPLDDAIPDGATSDDTTSDDTTKIAICGTRGWICPGDDPFTAQDEKIYLRELGRLELSLKDAQAKGADKIICGLHYPPTNKRKEPSGFTDLLVKYGVSEVVYGHLHGANGYKNGLIGNHFGIEFRLVSVDYTNCNLIQII
ncbi:MAG: metallophosphoesterase [Clostridiales Family XIII bacterium]|jgi:predicted phosphohydrolase|nr:metallophosphoesterase [Clostridiales Family XIII bacterium]